MSLVCQLARQLLQLGLGQCRIGVGADTHSTVLSGSIAVRVARLESDCFAIF